MKHFKQIFQALLGVVALIITAVVAAGRLALRTTRNCWKNRSKRFRRIIKIALTVIVLGFITNVGYAIYKYNYGRYYWADRNLSDNITLHGFQNDTYRLYDNNAQKYVTPRFDWVVSGNDSLAVYAYKGKRGFININTGEIVIDAEKNNYSKAWLFSEGVAAVVQDGKIGFIDSGNSTVIPFQFHYTEHYDNYCDIEYLFHNGYCSMNNNDKWGIIDTRGEWVIDAKYEQIWTPATNGMRIVTNEDKYGLLAADMSLLYPVEYDCISIAENGAGIVLTKGGRMWQVDDKGEIVNPFLFDYCYWIDCPDGYNEESEFIKSLTPYMKYEVLGRCGIFNRFTGEVVTPAIYSDIIMISDKLFQVQDPNTYDWTLIECNGNMVIGK